jgi:acyl-CoA synthetase (AMP-forming)/AMP-acid ligase II
MRIDQFVRSSAGTFGSDTAIISAGRAYSYRELALAAERLAAALVRRGIGPGTRIGILMESTFAAAVVIFAAMRAGAVVCVMDENDDAEELSHALAGRGATALAIDTRYAALAAAALREANGIATVVVNGRDAGIAGCIALQDVIARIGPVGEVTAPCGADDAAIVFSPAEVSGRAVALSHAELAACAEGAEPQPSDTLRSILTFGGVCHLIKAIRTGVPVRLGAAFERPRSSLQEALKWKALAPQVPAGCGRAT